MIGDEVELVLPTSWEPDRSRFFAKLGIKPGGLAAQLFDPVFDSLFVRSEDARRDFDMYYSVEYGTLESYLEARHGIVLGDADLEKAHIFLCRQLPSLIDTNWGEGNKLDEVLQAVSELESASEDEN